MAVFAIIAQPDTNGDRLPQAIQLFFPGRHMSVGPGVWFVSAHGTPQDVSMQLGIADGQNGSAIVVEVAGYWGRATTGVWDWFRAYWGNGHRG